MDPLPGTASFADAPATVESMACMTVVPYGPEVEAGVGTRQEWFERMAPTYGALLAMVTVLRMDEQQLFELAKGAGSEAAFELHTWLHSTSEFLAAQAELLDQASVRVMVGMARLAVAGGGA